MAVPEEEKKLRTVIPWLEHWARIPLHRDATVVALGGGVLSDLTGLAASLFLRGIAWQVWPTTLLAMADAALGGKTGADLSAGKNLVGRPSMRRAGWWPARTCWPACRSGTLQESGSGSW
ncbi:MAG: hypothetical protein IPO28_07530 [Holophagaceae bacterium]|nr:hypothetical protein [Holophagaceae bacterium]